MRGRVNGGAIESTYLHTTSFNTFKSLSEKLCLRADASLTMHTEQNTLNCLNIM